MTRHHILALVAGTSLAVIQGTPAYSEDKVMSDSEYIASAERAAPPSISKNATIVSIGSDMTIRTLRKGTNNFTCLADDPTTPGPDPNCADANAWEWMMALMHHVDPPKGKVGFMFMMEGGTDSSNTDPFATKPEPGNNWIQTGPHVMIVGGDDEAVRKGYPTKALPDTTQPYVMYAGTPYAHLMVPVVDLAKK
jgi:hypothetical protein